MAHFPVCLVFSKAESRVSSPPVASVHHWLCSVSTLSLLPFFFLGRGGVHIHTWVCGETPIGSWARTVSGCLERAEMLFRWNLRAVRPGGGGGPHEPSCGSSLRDSVAISSRWQKYQLVSLVCVASHRAGPRHLSPKLGKVQFHLWGESALGESVLGEG